MPSFGISYFGNRYSHHAEYDMKEIAESGFRYVVHTFSEHDHLFCKENVKRIVDISKECGLRVLIDPWGICNVFGGEAFSRHLLVQHDIMQISKNGRKYPAACLNNPRFRKIMTDWIEAVSEMKPDGILWDEPHWAVADNNDGPVCMCEFCCRRYATLHGDDLTRVPEDAVSSFRIESTHDFIEHLCTEAKKHSLSNSVCLLPEWEKKEDYREWDAVASLKNLDVIGTDPYWFHYGTSAEIFVGRYSRIIRGLANKFDKEGEIWIQSFRIPPGREAEIAGAAALAIESGIENIAFWGFRACENMSCLDHGNADVVWDVICATVRKYCP
jgi:hypothetical protein